mgnify:CR=1 FL=1
MHLEYKRSTDFPCFSAYKVLLRDPAEQPDHVTQRNLAGAEIVRTVRSGEAVVQQFADCRQRIAHIEVAVAVKVARQNTGNTAAVVVCTATLPVFFVASNAAPSSRRIAAWSRSVPANLMSVTSVEVPVR